MNESYVHVIIEWAGQWPRWRRNVINKWSRGLMSPIIKPTSLKEERKSSEYNLLGQVEKSTHKTWTQKEPRDGEQLYTTCLLYTSPSPRD